MAVAVAEMTLAEWLDRAIERKGVTQGAVATYCGISTSAISEWRAGRRIPDPPYVWRLAKYFEAPVEEVMRYAGHLPPRDPAESEADPAVILARLPRDLVEAFPSLRPHDQDSIRRLVLSLAEDRKPGQEPAGR